MEFQYTLKREDIQKGAIFSLFLMICTQTSCVMIYHYSVMDKKMTAILYQNHSHFLVGRGGFEPPKSLTTDLQSVPFGHSGTLPYSLSKKVELVDGLEPPTCWLQISCSASWATPAKKTWCLGAESNHRHRDFQSLALPTELPRHTSFFDKCLYFYKHLSYGDPKGARTPDLQRDRLAY